MKKQWLVMLCLMIVAQACEPAKSPSEACRRAASWDQIGRVGRNRDPHLDMLENIRCDEMAKEERREAREDVQRREDRAERTEARREVLANLTPADPQKQEDPPNLSGLWVGAYGHDRLETVRIEQRGSRVFATKITGDTNVPAGKPTFTAVVTSGEGAGHVADEGYQNPRWIPGHLSVLTYEVIEFDYGGLGPVQFKRIRE